MAKKTKQKRAEHEIPCSPYIDEVISFACSVVTIDDLPPDVPQDFIIKSLIYHGEMVYLDGPLAGWYLSTRGGLRDRYGRPKAYFLRTLASDAAPFEVPADKTVRIRANALSIPPLFEISRLSNMVSLCDRALRVNLLSSMSTRMFAADTPETENSIRLAFDDFQDGRPGVVRSDILATMQNSDVSVPFRGGELHALRTALLHDLYKKFGAITPAQYKAERTQSAEVSANIAESIDNIYVLIEQFNRDAEAGGLACRMRYTGYGARYDIDPQEGGANDEQAD